MYIYIYTHSFSLPTYLYNLPTDIYLLLTKSIL